MQMDLYMTFLRNLFASLLLITLTTSTFAADRWYEVEVLVFAQTKPDLLAEKWPVNDAGPLLNGAVMINSALPSPAAVIAAGASTGDVSASANDALRVSVLSAAQLQLKDALKTLSRSRQYRPLLHTGWRQPIGSGKDTFKVRLAAGKDFSAEFGSNGQLLSTGAEPAIPFGLWELDGYIKLTASRFLHVESDLVFRALQTVPVTNQITPLPETTAAPDKGDNSNLTWQSADTPITQNQLQFYRLTQNRRVKANEIHYFDHPLYGMIIELRPLEGRNDSDSDAEE